MTFKTVWWYVLVLAAVVVLTALYVGRRDLIGRYWRHEARERQVNAAQQECKDLEKKIEASRKRIEHLGSDPVEIEAAIRRSKDLVRPGEQIYRIEKAPGQ